MISVVIPALNEETFLPQCLESLRDQDYRDDYEIIVVDNASTDGTARVATGFGATVISCPRKGVAYARQAGVQAASGEIVVQADADTIYPQDWLTRIAKHFSSHPRSVALAGTFIYRYRDEPPWARIEYSGRYLINIICRLFFGRPVIISGANFAFRRKAFQKSGGYDEHSLYPDQWGIAHRLARIGKVSYDKTLSVSTSSRRVQKPSYIILFELLGNLSGVIIHFTRYATRNLKTSLTKLPISRTPARLATSISLVSIVSLLLYGYLAPTSQVFGKVYYQNRTSDKIVALTFDDGPNEPYTSEILDILDSYNIKATFFAVGENVELYPQIAKRIVTEGHIIANHSYSHKANHALSSYGYHDLNLAQEAITRVIGVSPHLYRPPHGKKSPWELHTLTHEKLVEVTWSVSANDQHVLAYLGKPSPEILAKEIVSKVKPGGIILLHDGYGTNHGDIKADKSLTVQALPLIIKELQKQGFRFVTVPELLSIPAYQ